jgi:hypothetical protein
MPKVGNKKFSYDAEGIKKAQEHAAKTGEKIEKSTRYNKGGMVGQGGKGRISSRGQRSESRKKTTRIV